MLDMLCMSQILHITIIKTIKFIGGREQKTEKVLMAHWAFHVSNHMAMAFKDVLFILFQLSYFSDSKTYLFYILSSLKSDASYNSWQLTTAFDQAG